MHYLYSEKSFARDLFDAAKSQLRKPFPDAALAPRHWLDAMNYGSNFTPFHNSIKFRSMRGIALRIASAPLCTHDPAVIARLQHPASAVKPEAPPLPDSEAAVRSSPASGVNTPPCGYTEPQQKPACDRPDVRAAAIQETADKDDASQQPPSRISTPVLSTLLGLTVAITVGIVIGNNNTSKLEIADSKHSKGLGAEALTPSADAAFSHAPHLTLDSTPPRTPISVAESKLASPKEWYRQDEASGKRMAVKQQPAKKKLHASARSARPSSASKERRKYDPAPQTATARRAPARAASGSTSAAVSHHPNLKQESPARLGTLYARCENVRGLLRQERCRWQVCGGKWGKQGCPAYQHKSMPEMGFSQLPPPSSEHTADGG